MARRPRVKVPLKAVLWVAATRAAGVTVGCHWCGVPLAYASATCDHEPPLAEGGDWRSAVLACDGCNQARGRTTNDAVKARRRKRG